MLSRLCQAQLSVSKKKEIKKFDLEGKTVLIPRTIGKTNAQKLIKSKWTEIEYQRALGDETKIKLLTEIEHWATSLGISVELNDSKKGGKAFRLNGNTLFSIFTDGVIQFRMGFLNNKIFNNNKVQIDNFMNEVCTNFGENSFTANKGFGNILLDDIQESNKNNFFNLIKNHLLI